jgi:hypothetical protein
MNLVVLIVPFIVYCVKMYVYRGNIDIIIKKKNISSSKFKKIAIFQKFKNISKFQKFS